MTSMDERRAMAMATAKYAWVDAIDIRWGMLSASHREGFLDQARAIRESDEAAGMVLVPREALENLRADTEKHPLDVGFVHHEPTRKELAFRLELVRSGIDAMIAAATEADNDR